MKTAIQFHEELLAAVAAPSQAVREHGKLKKSEVGHQGDVYIHKITKRPAAWDVLVTEHSQVALGSTIGSRHIATGSVHVYWPKAKDAAVKECPIKLFTTDEERRVCIGPIVEADESWTLEHPEHAHHRFAKGIYLVTYQLDWNTKREVRD